MSAQIERHRAEMKQLAYPAIEKFVADNPQFSVSVNQSGSASVTNYVIFGHHHRAGGTSERVIFKYFCEDERKDREVYALHHFSATEIVPELIADVGPRLIVQSYIPGGWLPAADDPACDTTMRERAGYTLGQGVATLLAVPLSPQAAQGFETRFYDGLQLEDYFRNILDASWQIHRSVDVYKTELFSASLASIEAQLPFILAQPRLLYHQDALNMHFVDGRFAGFFDLEMCRVGTAPMQIGSLWHIFATYANWRAFARGYAEVSGTKLDERDFAAAQAFANFLIWRYLSRYGRWHGEEGHSSHAQADADAKGYAEMLILNNGAQS